MIFGSRGGCGFLFEGEKTPGCLEGVLDVSGMHYWHHHPAIGNVKGGNQPAAGSHEFVLLIEPFGCAIEHLSG